MKKHSKLFKINKNMKDYNYFIFSESSKTVLRIKYSKMRGQLMSE